MQQHNSLSKKTFFNATLQQQKEKFLSSRQAIFFRKIFTLIIFTLLTLNIKAQNCPYPAPIITTDFNSECILYDGDFHPLPGNDCWQVCENGIVHYSVLPNAGNTYVWTVGGGTITAGQGTTTIDVLWGASGTGVVQITEYDANNCSYSVEHCITIIPSPVAFFTTQPFNDSQNGSNLQICSGQTVYFFGHVKQNSVQSPIASWYWEYNDPFSTDLSSTDQNPHHQFSQPGSYLVTLTVTNECGCTGIAYMVIDVTPDVAVDIECPTPVCEGGYDTYTVNIQCPPPLGQYLWTIDPPGAGTITSPPPYGNTITVHWLDGSNGPGIVSFTGVNCNTACNATASIVVPIITSHANIQGSSIICSDNLVAQYSVPQMPGSTYTWSVNGGSIISGDNTNSVIVNWQACVPFPPCTHSIDVTYANTFFGCPGGTSHLDITIKDPMIVTGDQTVCAGNSVKYYVTGSLNNFEWSLLDIGGSVVLGPVVQSPPWTIPGSVTSTLPPGSYTVQVNDLSGDFCNTTVNYSLTINPLPPAPSAITGELKVCSGASYVYSCTPNNPGDILTWTITGSTTAIAFGTSVTITWQSPNYSISVVETDANTGCISQAITLNPVQKLYIQPVQCALQEYSVSAQGWVCIANACLNTQKTYKIFNFSTYNIDQMQWSIVPENIGTITSYNYDALLDELTLNIQWNNTAYNGVQIILKSYTCGNLNSPDGVFTLDVIGGSNYTITANPNPGCEHTPVTFNVSPLPSGWTQYGNYTWNYGDDPTNYTNPISAVGVSHPYSIGGSGLATFPITVQIDVDGCKSSASSFVNVIPGPGAYISASAPNLCNPPVTLTAYPSGLSYSWSTGATSQSIPVSVQATYTVTVTGTNGCTDFADAFVPNCPPTCLPLQNVTINLSGTATSNCGEAIITGSIGGSGTWQSYSISFGDASPTQYGSTSPFSYTHSFPVAGNYNVCVTAFFTDASGTYCYTQCATVNIPLVAKIIATLSCPTTTNASGALIYDYTFTAYPQSASPVNPYSWTFDGGGFGSNNPVAGPIGVDFTTGHTVAVTMTNSSLTCTQTLVLSQPAIPVPPSANFTVSPAIPGPYCEKQTVLDFNFSGNLAYVHHANWTFGDGADYSPLYPFPTSNIDAQRIYDAFTDPSFRTVTLNVYDVFGCPYSSNQNVTIKENKLFGHVDPYTQSFCPGASGSVTYIPVGINGNGALTPTGYLWSTSSTLNPLIVASTGQYYVTVYDNASGCKYEAPKFADVAVKNVPNPIIRGNTDYCLGDPIFQNGYVGGVTYQWVLDPGLALSSGNLTSSSIHLLPPAVGSYNIQLTVTLNGCSLSVIKAITVHAPPPTPTLTAVPSPTCENNAVAITATNYVTPLVLTWSNGMNGNPITVHNSGAYNATFTDPTTGCFSQSGNISVNPNPDLSWLITGCLDRCDNDVNHVIIPGSGGIQYHKWNWIINNNYLNPPYQGSNSAVNSLDVNQAIAGGGAIPPGVYIIQISVVDDNGCTTLSEPLYLTVRTCPCKIDYVKEDSYKCLGTDLYGMTYVQFQFTVHFNGGFSPTGTFQLIPSPLNGFPITPWTFNVLGSDVIIEGILGFNPRANHPCYTLIYTDPNPAFSCTFNFCVKPPTCSTKPCDWAIEPVPDQIFCIGTDVNGNHVYSVAVSVILGQSWSVIYSAIGGSLTGFPSTIGPGNVLLTGTFTDTPPYDRELCMQINFYDVTTGEYCYSYICFELPDCGDTGGGTRSAATENKNSQSQPNSLAANLNIQPNPASNLVFAQFSFTDASEGDLILMDAHGSIVSKKHVVSQQGYSQYDCSTLNPGIYLIHLTTPGGTSIYKKITVIK